jgi:hypothetical protein
MPKRWKARYLDALRPLNLREVAEETGRGYRTLHSYLRKERGVSREAARELVAFLRSRADTLTVAADAIDAALDEEDEHGA